MSNLKPHNTQAMDYIFIQEKLLPRLTFNPGLALAFEQPGPGLQQQRSDIATPLGFQRALEKGTEDKILRDEYIDFALILGFRPLLPERRGLKKRQGLQQQDSLAAKLRGHYTSNKFN